MGTVNQALSLDVAVSGFDNVARSLFLSLAICHIQPSPIISSYSLSVHAQHSTLGCPTRH
jgi:hypothetical protein